MIVSHHNRQKRKDIWILDMWIFFSFRISHVTGKRLKPFFPHNTTSNTLTCAHNRRRESKKRNTKDQFQYLLHTHSLSFINNVWSKQQILFLFQHQLGKFQHPIIISPRTDRDPRLGAFDVRKQRQRPLRVHREGRRHERTRVDG